MFFFICHLFIIGYFFIERFFIGISFHRNSCRLQIISAEMCETWISFCQNSFPVFPDMNVCILGSLFSKIFMGGLDLETMQWSLKRCVQEFPYFRRQNHWWDKMQFLHTQKIAFRMPTNTNVKTTFRDSNFSGPRVGIELLESRPKWSILKSNCQQLDVSVLMTGIDS